MIVRTRELPRWNGVMLVGISRGVVGIEPVNETDQVVFKKKLFPGRFCFQERICFGERKKEEARERLMFVVHGSLLKHWKIESIGDGPPKALGDMAKVHMKRAPCWTGSRWWTWGSLMATGHHITCKRIKQKLASQAIIFPASSPRPKFQCCLSPKLLYNEPLHLQDLAFNVEIGGGEPSVV